MIKRKIDEKCFTVYMHTSPNGKRYIGITSQRPVRRWGGNGYGYIDNIYFWRAIQKYGWDNFQHEILFKGLTKEEAEQKEIELIAFYDSTNPNKGYNITSGGGYSFNVILMPVKQYTMDGIFVKEYECIKDASEETDINKGNISLCCNNERKTTGGYIWRFAEDDLTAEHLAWCNSNGHQNEWVSVCQYSKDGEFIRKYKNLTFAASENNTNPTSIISCCKGESKFTANSIWRYADEELTEAHLNWCNNGKTEKNPVLQYSLLGELISYFDGILIASRSTGTDPSSITRCCKNRQKIANGYIWRYADEQLTQEHLEWCLSSPNNGKQRSVSQYNRLGVFICTYSSITEASIKTGVYRVNIESCCRNNSKTAGGFLWRYSEDEITKEYIERCNTKETSRQYNSTGKQVCQYTIDGKFVAKYDSLTEANKQTRISRDLIRAVCKGEREQIKGYIWRYASDIQDPTASLFLTFPSLLEAV